MENPVGTRQENPARAGVKNRFRPVMSRTNTTVINSDTRCEASKRVRVTEAFEGQGGNLVR